MTALGKEGGEVTEEEGLKWGVNPRRKWRNVEKIMNTRIPKLACKHAFNVPHKGSVLSLGRSLQRQRTSGVSRSPQISLMASVAQYDFCYSAVAALTGLMKSWWPSRLTVTEQPAASSSRPLVFFKLIFCWKEYFC